MPPQLEPENLPEDADSLRALVKLHQESVTQHQMSAETVSDEIKQAEVELQTALSSVLAICVCLTSQERRLDPNDQHGTEPSAIMSTLSKLQELCLFLQRHTKSVADAKKVDGTIANKAFDLSTSAEDISKAAARKAHKRQAQLHDMKELEEAVAWWEKHDNSWRTLHATAVKARDDLCKDARFVEAISPALRTVERNRVCELV
jgi:DNA repair ATPase RecN